MLILIVLFGLVLRVLFFSGVGTSDDLGYSLYANNIDEGIDPDSVLTLSSRIGIIYATAFSYKLFGIHDFSSTIFGTKPFTLPPNIAISLTTLEFK